MKIKDYVIKTSRSVRLIALIVVITMFAMTIAVAATNAKYDVKIIDGEKIVNISTKSEDAKEVLKEAGIEFDNDDSVLLDNFKYGYSSEIKLVRNYFVKVIYHGDESNLKGNNTVADTLKDNGYTLKPNDICNYDLVTDVTDNMEIVITKGNEIYVSDEDMAYRAISSKGTVEEILKDMGITLGQYDETSPARDKVIDKDTRITINRVVYKEKIVKETIKFSTKTKNDSSMNSGTSKVVTKGVNGEQENVYREKYINGKFDSKEKVSSTVVKKAVDEVKSVGTKGAVKSLAFSTQNKKASGTVINDNNVVRTISNFALPANYTIASNKVPTSYKKVISGNATAYCGGGITSTGKAAQPGYVAVNPKIIPYGTKMWIVSSDGRYTYGYAIAADTGGFIYSTNFVADLYFNSYNECVNFGVRNIDIYIL